MTPGELAAWRAKNEGNIASSRPGISGVTRSRIDGEVQAPRDRFDPTLEVVPDSTAVEQTHVKPLDARDTQKALMGHLWNLWRSDRRQMQMALAWVRRRAPDAVAHMTDRQLFDHLEDATREATTRVLQDAGRLRSAVLDGKY
ncbi:hypothetical protein LCGC14_0397390 [marine sediment metagenome]|uniref:Uncharacterized protein n=1 Tax=marine sediment metagenome TaxID=412755 RepID=A0A0F9VJW0_9ZZZZ